MRSEIPAVNFVFSCQFVFMYCAVLTYFHMMTFRQLNFLKFFNLLKQDSFQMPKTKSKSRIVWKKRCCVFFHCLVGIPLISFWNLNRLLSREPGIQLKVSWNIRVYGIRDPSKMEELNTFKLVAAFVLEIMGHDSINFSVCAVVLVYFVAMCIRRNASHLHRVLTDAEKFCVVSSSVVKCRERFSERYNYMYLCLL